VSLQAI
jgi:hydrogenase maturation factor